MPQNQHYGQPTYGGGNNRQNGGGNRHFNGNSPQDPTEEVKKFFNDTSFKPSWVTEGADRDMPDYADKMGEYMAKNGLTNSKIRSIYGEIKRIQMKTYEEDKASFFLLRPKVAYALGRDSKNKGIILFKLIFDEARKSVSDQETYNNFCNLFEAILAYHKAHGGKD